MNCQETTDICITQGDDESFIVSVKDENGDSLLKSGCKLWLTVKRSIGDPDSNAVKQVTNTLTADTNEAVLALSKTDTNQPLGTYYYDIQLKDNSGLIKTVLKGKMTITYQVTDSI